MKRILVVSDIHSNVIALEAVLEDSAKHGIFTDKLCAGDVVGYGPDPNECIEALVREGFTCVQGNHDEAILMADLEEAEIGIYALDALKKNRKRLSEESLDFLRKLRPLHISLEGDVSLVHGSFDELEILEMRGHVVRSRTTYCYKYILEGLDAMKAMKALISATRVGIYGHTHIPAYSYTTVPLDPETKMPIRYRSFGRITPKPRDLIEIPKGNIVLFNPGSVGQPRTGRFKACYGIATIDEEKVELEFCDVHYDARETQRRMKKQGMPSDLVDRLVKDV